MIAGHTRAATVALVVAHVTTADHQTQDMAVAAVVDIARATTADLTHGQIRATMKSVPHRLKITAMVEEDRRLLKVMGDRPL